MESKGGKRGAPVFPGRVADRSLNTKIFLPFVLLKKETGRSFSEHRGDDKSDEESIDEKEVSHMTTVKSVVTEIGLTHPIVSDFYDLCDYVKKKKIELFYCFHA